MTFKELNISEPILRALDDKNYEIPTPIQIKAIPVAIDNIDLLGIAQTGTGKTAAFSIPIIQQLLNKEPNKGKRVIKALILTPTRELAIQIGEDFEAYGKYTKLRHTVIFGGVKQSRQTDELNRGVDILIATPGRLLDLISQKIIYLNNIEHFVLDEADRMLDMGFIHDIRRLLPLLPKKKQTLLFSATMPKEIVTISKSLLNNPARVEVAPVSSVVDIIEQKMYIVEKEQKKDLLLKILAELQDKSVLIFSRTKHGADKIARILNKNNIACDAIHGNKSQNARQNALNNFKTGKTHTIVATDIAARGIDIPNLAAVINYDLPDVAETYVHRIGRTGRAGNDGISFSFCTNDEKNMLKDIEKLIKKSIETIRIPASPKPQVATTDSTIPEKVTRTRRSQASSNSEESSKRRGRFFSKR